MSTDVKGRALELPRNEAAALRASWRAEVSRQRTAGELLDVADALAVFGIEEELRARGWDRRWRRPPGEARQPGRWPGSRHGGYPESITLRLPSRVAERVLSACWWTSASSIARLRTWRDENPGIAIPLRSLDGQRQSEGPLAEYERLSGRVTTVGDVYRAALERGITAAVQLSAEALPEVGGWSGRIRTPETQHNDRLQTERLTKE
ncbi:hypothetical protein [Streptomyces sp. NPDC051662]|uniref:hypothetical protein n=1 Tax=Streptomyces sp. NPDC051662 TaxID=3154750 RepID=UPI00342CF774